LIRQTQSRFDCEHREVYLRSGVAHRLRAAAAAKLSMMRRACKPIKHPAWAVTLALLGACGSGSTTSPDARVPDSQTPDTQVSHTVADAGADTGTGRPDAGVATALGLLVTPSVAHLAPGDSLLFSATVSGIANTSVLWSVQAGTSGGGITSAGLYTAPTAAGTYQILAQSQGVSTLIGSATVVVTPVASCATLPAAGIWDTVSISPVTPPSNPPNVFVGTSAAVVIDPFDSSTVWLGTGYSGLFKSTDCGATWTHVNTGMNGSAIDQSVLWSMTVDPVNQGVIYAVGAYGAEGLWKSTDGGVDWVQLFPSTSKFAQVVPYNFVANVSMDAANSMHLAVSSHGVCNDPYPLGCIAESFDGGATWPNIVSMPQSWAENGGVQIINATTWIWGGGDSELGLYVTTNNGQTWTQARPNDSGDGNGEFSTQPLERAVDGAYYASSLEGVIRSTDGITWSLAWGQNKSYQTAQVIGIAVSATTIYGSNQENFFSAPISDYTNWSSMAGPAGLSKGITDFLAYDAAHHLLYASSWAGGLFRLVTD
jgi:hypothetical protein